MSIQTDTHDTLTRTFSDAGFFIIQDESGAEYQEAWDPIDHPRTYTESTRKIETPEPDQAPDDIRAESAAMVRAAEIMLGGE